MIDRCLHDVLRTHAADRPERIAFHAYRSGGRESISYRALHDRAAAYAAFLAENDVARGDRVLILFRHDPHLLYAFFGAMMAGACPLILPFPTARLDPDAYAASMRALIPRIAPAFIFADTDLQSTYTAMVRGADSRTIVRGPVECEHAAPDWTPPCIETAAVAFLQHSSGSTGLQKGVALTHDHVMAQVTDYGRVLGLHDGDSIVSWLPLYHDMGLVACTILPVAHGLTTHWLSPFDWIARPRLLLEIVTRHRPSLCWMPNFAFSLLATRLDEADLRGLDLGSIRAWISCGEPVLGDTMERFEARFRRCGVAASALSACYAMAENVFAMAQTEIGQPLDLLIVDRDELRAGAVVPVTCDASTTTERLVSCGPAVDGTEIVVLAEDGAALPADRVGEIAIRGRSRFAGYAHEKETLAAEACFRTGDLGFVHAGNCYVSGRRKDLIIQAGRNIFPQDVEDLVSLDEAIVSGRVVAVGVPDPASGTERIVVIAESPAWDAPETEVIAARLRAGVSARLDATIEAVRLVAPGCLLKTSSGKVARTANRVKFLETVDA